LETKALLRKIQLLEIRAKGLTKDIFSGEYQAAFKGRGMAFSEVRNYQFGDEVRTIDWNVTARYNEPFIKVFEEERELTVMLLVDLSGSAEFGRSSQSKKDLAIEIAAILTFSAIANNDKVGAIILTDKVERYIAPQKGRKHALFLLSALLNFQPVSKGTSLNEGLKFLNSVQKKRSIVFILSDFIDENEYLKSLKLAKNRHDTIAIKLFDRAEIELPNFGWMQLFNAETRKTSWIDSSSQEAIDLFYQEMMKKDEQLQTECRKAGIDLITCETNVDFIKPLTKMLKDRR
jgi:uncharacterized protein (DUF58 family)